MCSSLGFRNFTIPDRKGSMGYVLHIEIPGLLMESQLLSGHVKVDRSPLIT